MDVKELSRRVQDATPFIKLLGIEVTRADGDGYAEMRMPVRPEMAMHTGEVHGGVVGTLADVAANMAYKRPSYTVEYKINFLAVADGDELISRSRVVKSGKTLIIAQSDVFSVKGGEEKHVATCLATLVPSPRSKKTSL